MHWDPPRLVFQYVLGFRYPQSWRLHKPRPLSFSWLKRFLGSVIDFSLAWDLVFEYLP
jgi:hypothetical protein